MNKCFGCGLSRTGTKSLNDALVILGFDVRHYPDDAITAREVIAGLPFSILRRCDGLTDLHATSRFRGLDAAYPGSRFILTVREKASWLKSIGKHRPYDGEATEEPQRTMTRTFALQVYGREDFDERAYAEVYDRHERAVKDHFRGRSNLLVLDIVGGEGWSRLSPFLGVPVPTVPFPRAK